MIAFLDGVLEEKQPTRVVLNVAGVGYEVLIPLITYDRLPPVGERCRLLIHDHVREDARLLFGFFRPTDREMFESLLSINGIGPKLALSVLSGLNAREIKSAVIEGDVKRLSSVSGIGRKMAERMVLELGHKVTEGDRLEAASGAGEPTAEDLRLRDAVLALVALGYKQADAYRLARDAMADAGPDEPVDAIVKRALVR